MPLACPSPKELQSFLEGAVSSVQSCKISNHLDECARCDDACRTFEQEGLDFELRLRNEWLTSQLLQEPEVNRLRNEAIKLPTVHDLASDCPSANVRRVRDYKLVKKIGEGGMGTVYQAVHLHLGKVVALKILPEDKLHSPAAVSRFQQEMRAVGKLSHPNVVSASDAGTEDGRQFLVMELVEGADLARIMKKHGVIDIADACEIVRQAALGLEHAHQNGLVHRDVKPSNIMLSLHGEVKLLDLGLAGLNFENPTTDETVANDRLTTVGQIIGTLDYMAPEHASASAVIDHKADLYALGSTLFALVTGAIPCGNRGESTIRRIESLLNDAPRKLIDLAPDAPPGLSEFIERLLSKSPDDRPQTAGEVAQQLEKFAAAADLTALADTCRTSLDIPSADVDITEDVSLLVTFPQKAPEVLPPESRNWVGWAAGITSAALILGLLGLLFFPAAQPKADDDQHEPIAAEIIFKQGDWRQAPQIAEQEVKRHPEAGWLHAKAAMLWAYQMGHGEKEERRDYLRHCEWLTNRWKDTGEGSNTIPRVCCVYSDGTDQHAAMLKAVLAEEKRHPKDWRLPHSAMMLNCRLGRYDQALEAFKRCRKISPTNRMHAALDHTWKALALYRLNRGDEAWEVQEQSIAHYMKIKPTGENKLPDMWFDFIELMVVMCEVSLISSEYPFDQSNQSAKSEDLEAGPPTSNYEQIQLVGWREVGEKIMHADISEDGAQIVLAVGWRPGKWQWITPRPSFGKSDVAIPDDDVVRHVGGQPVRSVGIHPSKKYVALGRWYGAVDIVALETNEIIATYETAIGKLRKANDVEFNEAGDLLFIGYQSNRMVVWNWKDDKVLAQKTFSKPVWNVHLGDNNTVFKDGSIWNWKSGKETQVVESPAGANWLAPDGSALVTSSGKTLTVHFIDEDSSKPIYDLELEHNITCIESIDNTMFIGHELGEVSVYDPEVQKVATIGRLMPNKKVRQIYVANKSGLVMATTGDKVANGRIAIWRVGDMKTFLQKEGTLVTPRLRGHWAATVIQDYKSYSDVQKQLLKMLEGDWKSGNQLLSIQRNEWVWSGPRNAESEKTQPGGIKITGSRDGLIEAELHVATGKNAGRTVYALFQPMGDTLLYCGSYASRPKSIYDNRKGMYFFQWQRVDRNLQKEK